MSCRIVEMLPRIVPGACRRAARSIARCRVLGVQLGIGLTPFEIYLDYDAGARAALRDKVLHINEISPDILCILFDDMRGDIHRLPQLQGAVIADICAWSHAARFIVCPTYYSYDARLADQFGAPPKAYLRDFGAVLDPRIDVFWTGEKVISHGYPAAHLDEVAADLRRKPFIWDNHVSNDSSMRTNHLYLDPTTSTWELPRHLIAGMAINPMNQPYLARIALRAFRTLLGGPYAKARNPLDVRLFSEHFAAQLREDAPLLQTAGLDQLDSDMRGRLLDRYAPKTSNPYAQEISAWLRNEYRFDPECLTD